MADEASRHPQDQRAILIRKRQGDAAGDAARRRHGKDQDLGCGGGADEGFRLGRGML